MLRPVVSSKRLVGPLHDERVTVQLGGTVVFNPEETGIETPFLECLLDAEYFCSERQSVSGLGIVGQAVPDSGL